MQDCNWWRWLIHYTVVYCKWSLKEIWISKGLMIFTKTVRSVLITLTKPKSVKFHIKRKTWSSVKSFQFFVTRLRKMSRRMYSTYASFNVWIIHVHTATVIYLMLLNIYLLYVQFNSFMFTVFLFSGKLR